MTSTSIYENINPLTVGTYGITEAARYLNIPVTTLRYWIYGRPHPVEKGKRGFQPLIQLPDESEPILSFQNLVEAHVLRAIRDRHKVAMPKVRTAIDYLRGKFNSESPLTDQRLETDGINLFVHKFEQLINLSQKGQLAMKIMLDAHLKRIEWDTFGFVARLYPVTRSNIEKAPKIIVIDPHMSFGKPVIAGTGITTSVVAERFEAGESVYMLKKDYGLRGSQVEEAIRYEYDRAA
jgi:uncharacterized protein (DUF433 family)